MTSETIPEPGPARDRAVAYLLGWRPFAEQRGEYTHVVWVPPGRKPGQEYRDPPKYTELTPDQISPKRHIEHCLNPYSTDPADALAALEAWRAEHPWRFWEIGSPLVSDPDCRTWNVVLYQSVESDEGAWSGEGPTLPSAATAALLATGEGT